MKKEHIDFNKNAILNALRQAGLNSAKIVYCGGGDEGQLDSIEYLADGKAVELGTHVVVEFKKVLHRWDATARELVVAEENTSVIELEKALNDFLWDCLANHGHGGFHNGNGGNGELLLDAVQNTCLLEHSDNITETSEWSHEI